MIETWMTQLEQCDPIRCAQDQVFSPVDARDVVQALIVLAEQNAYGTYNLCGPRPWTRLALLRMLSEEVRKYRAVRARIVPCSIRDFDFAEPRPLDTSMSANKLYATLGYSFEDMALVCARAAKLRYAGVLTR
jgi:dTDP-4-dehydrorhamnose reductase